MKQTFEEDHEVTLRLTNFLCLTFARGQDTPQCDVMTKKMIMAIIIIIIIIR
jgi:hypothetical protein